MMLRATVAANTGLLRSGIVALLTVCGMSCLSASPLSPCTAGGATLQDYLTATSPCMFGNGALSVLEYSNTFGAPADSILAEFSGDQLHFVSNGFWTGTGTAEITFLFTLDNLPTGEIWSGVYGAAGGGPGDPVQSVSANWSGDATGTFTQTGPYASAGVGFSSFPGGTVTMSVSTTFSSSPGTDNYIAWQTSYLSGSQSTPEPSSTAMIILGLSGVAFVRSLQVFRRGIARRQHQHT